MLRIPKIQKLNFGYVKYSDISDLSEKKSELGDPCFESISLFVTDPANNPIGEIAINFYTSQENGTNYSQLIQYSYSYPILSIIAPEVLPILADNDSATNPEYMIADLKEKGYKDITSIMLELSKKNRK